MASVFINLPAISTSAPIGGATEAKQDVGNASLASIDGKTPALGQALDAASVPVVLTASQLSTLTPPSAITGFATETTLSTLNGKVPALGQALAAASVPVVLTASQLTTLTPPAAITGFALETTQSAQSTLIGAVNETAPATDTASSGLNGRLQRIAQRITSFIALVPTSLGQKTMANSFAVTLASDQTAIPTSATTQSTSGTITQTQKSVGTSAVRLTVSGSAPTSTRKRLMIKPATANTGSIYIGSSSVTTSNGLLIVGPDRLDFLMDASDYYAISDVASQVVEIVEVS